MAILFVHTPYSLPECKECGMAAPSRSPKNQSPTPFGLCRYCCNYSEYDPPWYPREDGSELWNRPQALHEAAECFPQYHQPASEEAEPSPRYSKPVYTSPPLITERAPASLTPPRYIPDAQKYSDETETLDEDDSVSCSTCEASTFEQSENIHPDLNRGRTCDRMGCRDRGKTPALHPYLRIWKHCKYGHFLKLPTGWVSVLSSSSNCDGIRPQHLPSLPDDIADHVDHNTRCVS